MFELVVGALDERRIPAGGGGGGVNAGLVGWVSWRGIGECSEVTFASSVVSMTVCVDGGSGLWVFKQTQVVLRVQLKVEVDLILSIYYTYI